jgi:hypothetical protein
VALLIALLAVACVAALFWPRRRPPEPCYRMLGPAMVVPVVVKGDTTWRVWARLDTLGTGVETLLLDWRTAQREGPQ